MRKSHLLGAIVAVVAVLAASVSALADSDEAEFSIDGFIGFVGISQDPSNPTSVESKFEFSRRGKPVSVEIKTTNEMVIGALAAVRDCEGDLCGELATVLNGASLTSLHESTAHLNVTGIETRSYTLPDPFGEVPLAATVISGDIVGNLSGTVQIPTSQGALYGTTDLAINGTAGYVCFSPFLSFLGINDPLPGPILPCVFGQGQLLPIELDIVDTGRIDVQKQIVQGPNGPEIVDGNILIDGPLTVTVTTSTDLDLLVRQDPAAFTVSGGLQITDAEGDTELD